MGVPGRYRFARCTACGQAYLRLRPAPTALAAHYPEGYVHAGRSPAWIREWFRRRDLRPRVRLARECLGGVASGPACGPALLDVGCGEGAFLAAARAAGFTVEGIEPTGWAAELARLRGLRVHRCEVSAAPLEAERYDAVTLWDVIEHLPDPTADLARLHGALRPGGRLIASTPVLDGWEARVMGEAWPGWDPPRHLSVFSRASLTALLDRSGFTVVGWRYVSEAYLITALALSIAARERLPSRAGGAVRTAIHFRPLRELMRPIFAVLDRALGGCSVTVIAQRRADLEVTPSAEVARP